MPTRRIIIRNGSNEDAAYVDPSEVCKIQPTDNVYSFLMFTLPLEHKANKDKGNALDMSSRTLVAYVLVFATLFIKAVLLYAIFKGVVMEGVSWQQGIMEPPKIPSFFHRQPESTLCNSGTALCSTAINGTFTCAPPSVQLAGRWSDLDTDNDGVWTHDEAVGARDALQCQYAVDPVEVFDVFQNFLLAREKQLWIHPDIRAGRGIHQAYFTYAAGDLIMCGYRTQKMCANLLERGVFDAALRQGNSPRVGKTIGSALTYCRELLKEGGICESNLPSTYGIWKDGAEKQCRAPSYEKYVYRHPIDGHAKSVLLLDYEATKTFRMASSSNLFSVYRGIIIVLFLLVMYAELTNIAKCMMWCHLFPDAADFSGQEVVEERDPGAETTPKTSIQSISSHHRHVIGGISALRLALACAYIIVGISFLMRDTDWVTLLLNGVALVFVMEVGNALFSHVLNSQLQEDFLNTEPMFVQLGDFKIMSEQPSLRDLFGFATLCMVVFLISQVHLASVGYPLSRAMECACLSSGETCREAQAFDHHFWDRYWLQDLPAAFDTVAKLKLASGEGRRMEDIAGETSQLTPRRRQPPTEWEKIEPQEAPPESPPSPPPDAPSPPPPRKKRAKPSEQEEEKDKEGDGAEKITTPEPLKGKKMAHKLAKGDAEGSISWYLHGSGRHFEPRGRRRRSMLNKPKKPKVVAQAT